MALSAGTFLCGGRLAYAALAVSIEHVRRHTGETPAKLGHHIQNASPSSTATPELEKYLSSSPAQALANARRLLLAAKLVAIAGAAVVLVAANTQFLGEQLRIWASAAALAIGVVASLVGIRQVVALPRLERAALEAQTSSTLRAQLQATRGADQ